MPKLVRKKPTPEAEPREGPSPSHPQKVITTNLNSDDNEPSTELDKKLDAFAKGTPIEDSQTPSSDTTTGKSPYSDTIDPVPLTVEGPAPIKEGEIPSDEQIDQHVSQITTARSDDNTKFKSLNDYCRSTAKTAREERSARLKAEQDLADAKKKIPSDEEMERLRNAEKIVKVKYVEESPRWKEYDQQVEKISNEARSMLLSFVDGDNKTILEKSLDVIDKRGGVIKFSESNDRADGGQNDKNGKPLIANPDGTPMSEKAYFATKILDKLDPNQKTQFMVLTTEAKRKQMEKNAALEEAKANPDAAITADVSKAQKVFQEQAVATLESLKADELPKLGYPIVKPVLSNTDTPEEKATKEKIITQWDRVEKELNTNLSTPKAITTARWHAAAFPILFELLQERDKTISELTKRAEDAEAKWNGIKDHKRLRQTTPVETNRQKPTEKMQTTDEALTARFGANALNN